MALSLSPSVGRTTMKMFSAKKYLFSHRINSFGDYIFLTFVSHDLEMLETVCSKLIVTLFVVVKTKLLDIIFHHFGLKSR
jgi:hypothetical protein